MAMRERQRALYGLYISLCISITYDKYKGILQQKDILLQNGMVS